MDRETQELLGFLEVVGFVQESAQCALGRDELAGLCPTVDRQDLARKQELLEEGRRRLAEIGRPGVGHLDEARPLLKKLQAPHAILEPLEMLALLAYLKVGRDLQRAFEPSRWPLLHALTHQLETDQGLIADVERSFTPDGEVRDEAHPQLGRVRREQVSCREKVRSHLEKLLRGPKSSNLIDEPFVTNRNGRYVIPVRTERQGGISGIVHGASSSGATVFMEPMSAVEFNNQLTYQQERERELIRRVLIGLSDRLREHLPSLFDLMTVIGRIDALFAVCEFSVRYKCVVPTFASESRLLLKGARHPLLIAELGDDVVVPIDMNLRDAGGLVISGPNTGGKTVALKTVGLLALMGQAGLPVPAEEAVFPLFHQVLADIGDHQSIAQGLSTFSARILRLKSMMETLSPPSLILIDEIGTGTDPVHGAALAVAVLEFFLEERTLIIATTHHQAVKLFAASEARLENASVELDPQTQEPSYRLHFGQSAGSSGLEMAARLGLPAKLVDRARRRLSDADRQAEHYLEQLRREWAALVKGREQVEQQKEELAEERRRRIEEAQAETVRRSKEFEKALESWRREFEKESRRYVRSIDDRFEAARVREKLQKKQALLKEQFRRQFKKEACKAPQGRGGPQQLSPGDSVSHRVLKGTGRILSIESGKVWVDFDGKRMSCRFDELDKVEPQHGVRRLPANVSLNAVEEASSELNLVGVRVDDALTRADKFLDRAAVSALRSVDLIHGYGTGRLKKALAEFLDGHPHVSSYSSKGGVTRVELRD